MCIAILRKPNAEIPEHFLRNGYENNEHGAGFMYAQNGQLIIKKGYFSFESFFEEYQQVPKECVVAIHFRHATHGAINAENCHPFPINDNFALIHNGVIPGFGSEEVSDTGDYTNRYLHYLFNLFDESKLNLLDLHAPENLAFRYTLYTSSQGNKLVILRSNGEYLISGENKGKWIDNVWYSNNSMEYSQAEIQAWIAEHEADQAHKLQQQQLALENGGDVNFVDEDGDIDAIDLENQLEDADLANLEEEMEEAAAKARGITSL